MFCLLSNLASVWGFKDVYPARDIARLMMPCCHARLGYTAGQCSSRSELSLPEIGRPSSRVYPDASRHCTRESTPNNLQISPISRIFPSNTQRRAFTRPRSIRDISYSTRLTWPCPTFGARKNCNVPCSKSNCTSKGTSLLMLSETSRARGADLAKFERYFRENVSETCFSRMIVTPGSSDSATALTFFAV